MLCRRSSCVGSSYRCAKARCRWCARQLSRTLHPSHSRWRRCTSKPNFCLSLQSLQPTMQSPVRPPLAFPQPPLLQSAGAAGEHPFSGNLPPSCLNTPGRHCRIHSLSKAHRRSARHSGLRESVKGSTLLTHFAPYIPQGYYHGFHCCHGFNTCLHAAAPAVRRRLWVHSLSLPTPDVGGMWEPERTAASHQIEGNVVLLLQCVCMLWITRSSCASCCRPTRLRKRCSQT